MMLTMLVCGLWGNETNYMEICCFYSRIEFNTMYFIILTSVIVKSTNKSMFYYLNLSHIQVKLRVLTDCYLLNYFPGFPGNFP
jgi:hypothetical protein